jgi:membrane protease YdiL (CAAX protease family)
MLGDSSATTPSWSPTDAMLTFLAAVGTLSLWQIVLFGLHLPSTSSTWMGETVWTIGASGILLTAAVVGARRFGQPGAYSALRIRWPRSLDFAVGIAGGIALYFVAIWVQHFINGHFSSWVSWYATGEDSVPLTQGPWILAGVIQIFIVPIGEESLFRGFLYGGLRTSLSIVPAASISAGMFAVVHANPAIMPSIFFEGVVLALAFEWRRTLAMPMVIHGSILACFLVQGALR